MKFNRMLLASVMLMVAVPAAAMPLQITLDEYKTVTNDAAPICRGAFRASVKNAVDYVTAQADARGYSQTMRVVLLGLCISYGQGWVDGKS